MEYFPLEVIVWQGRNYQAGWSYFIVQNRKRIGCWGFREVFLYLCWIGLVARKGVFCESNIWMELAMQATWHVELALIYIEACQIIVQVTFNSNFEKTNRSKWKCLLRLCKLSISSERRPLCAFSFSISFLDVVFERIILLIQISYIVFL